MSALKDGRYEIELDKTRHLLFDLNVIDDLNDKYGGYDKLGEILDKDKNPHYIKDLKWILALLINEGADEGEEELTEKQVGKLINSGNMNTAIGSIFAAFNVSTTGGQPADEENPKIAATGTM
ncbi:hypothetical protein [Caproiciproducens sp.]